MLLPELADGYHDDMAFQLVEQRRVLDLDLELIGSLDLGDNCGAKVVTSSPSGVGRLLPMDRECCVRPVNQFTVVDASILSSTKNPSLVGITLSTIS